MQQLKAQLVVYEVELVAGFAADRPAFLDRRPGQSGAAAAGQDAGPQGMSEFFPDELALTLDCARAAATVLTEHALTLTGSLRATLEELAQGRLDWPRARALAAELGETVRGTDPGVRAGGGRRPPRRGVAVGAAVEGSGLRAELAARDAAASNRRRQRSVNVRTRRLEGGVSELVAGMTDELAAACHATIDELAWRAHEAGDDRPIGMLQVGVLADLIQRPWLVPDPVAAHIDVQVPLGALTADRFLTEGSELPAAFARPGSATDPRLPTASTYGACSKNDEGLRSWPWRIEVLRTARACAGAAGSHALSGWLGG